MKKTLYHGTITNFDFFDENYLGTNINDLLSLLGFHFTEKRELAEKLFAYDMNTYNNGYIITVEIEENKNNIIFFKESDLILDMLQFGLEQDLVTKYYYNKIKKLPYWDSFGQECIIKSLYNNGKRKISKNYIDKKRLAIKYKKELLSKGIKIIKYQNEIEWSDEKRFDYIILDPNLIQIINRNIV